jgi:hypothetical protein
MSDITKTDTSGTKFVSAEDTVKLLEILELALDNLDHVAGGVAAECACVNCCAHGGKLAGVGRA